jgi:murein DD-endopeptidase MepM/ murein hydrolase activator NlpD
MKIFKIFFWLICFFPLLAQATELTLSRTTVLPGSFFTIELPQHNITRIEAAFQHEPVLFFPITKPPNFDEPITRAEFIQLILDNHDFGETDLVPAPAFTDVPPGHPHYDYIQKSATLNLVNGYTNGKFGAYDLITRAQAAKILIQAFDPPQRNIALPSFPDLLPNNELSTFLTQAYKANLFKGYPDGLMRPDRSINFSEAEIIIQRILGLANLQTITKRSYLQAYAGVHRLSAPGSATLSLTLYSKENYPQPLKTTIQILPRTYHQVYFTMAKPQVKLLEAEYMEQSWATVNLAKTNPQPDQLWIDNFLVPAAGNITLEFGDFLYINEQYAGSHFGIDYARSQGTPILAANTGQVVLAVATPSFGNTIVIDHGLNIFTMYLHLSELKVSSGQMVNKGDLIGLMGSTGLSTGAHLHYTQFIGQTIIDPAEWH